MQKTFDLPTLQDTRQLGNILAECLGAGDVVLLSGPVGAGKTELARFCIQARLQEIGASEDVPSPTFTLVQVYDLIDTQIWHADLYRLSSEDELYELGLDAAFEDSICFVEWPENLGHLTPKDGMTIRLEPMAEQERKVTFEWSHEKWEGMIELMEFLDGSKRG